MNKIKIEYVSEVLYGNFWFFLLFYWHVETSTLFHKAISFSRTYFQTALDSLVTPRYYVDCCCRSGTRPRLEPSPSLGLGLGTGSLPSAAAAGLRSLHSLRALRCSRPDPESAGLTRPTAVSAITSCRTWNRTKIKRSKVSCPTFRRSGNNYELTHFTALVNIIQSAWQSS